MSLNKLLYKKLQVIAGQQWNSIFWSQESIFEVWFGDTSHRWIRFKSEASSLNRKIKFAPFVMVWRCMSAQKIGIMHIVDGNMTMLFRRPVTQPGLPCQLIEVWSVLCYYSKRTVPSKLHNNI